MPLRAYISAQHPSSVYSMHSGELLVGVLVLEMESIDQVS